MKYTISIDQVHAREWGLSFSEAAVFSFCNELSTWAEPILIDSQVWYFASRNKVLEELPMVTDKPDTIYRIYKTLNEKGVIRWQKNGEKDCVQLTAKGKEWNSEKNPSLGKKSEQGRKNFRDNSEKNPTYNNTIDNNTKDKRENAPAKKTETIQPEQPQITPPPDSAAPPSQNKRQAFSPPEVEEVAEYLEDIFLDKKWQHRFTDNPPETAETFHDHYTANGWMVGKNKMKDWKAACRNWLKNNERYAKPKYRTNVSGTPRTPAPLVSEETHRRALARTLAELGVTGS